MIDEASVKRTENELEDILSSLLSSSNQELHLVGRQLLSDKDEREKTMKV
jgi:hypothetical protein